MRQLHLSLGDAPAYLGVAEAVRDAIRTGRLRPGDVLPSLRTLAGQLGIHRHTVMAGLAELVAEGWLVARERSGYLVHDELPEDFFHAPGSSCKENPGQFHWRFARSIPSLPAAGRGLPKVRHSFQSGMPALSLVPVHELRSHLMAALRHKPARVLGYVSARGHEGFLAAVEEYLRRCRAVSGRSLLITNGAQEAAMLVALALLGSGDEVATTALGFVPVLSAFSFAGARLAVVDEDAHGMCPVALEQNLRRGKIRLIYLTPHHHYPSTRTLPAHRRMQIYELARRHGVPILEDDYDHEFHFRCRPVAPIAAHDPAGLVIYISTFSKILYPSVRLGLVAASDGLIARLADLKCMLSRQCDAVAQEMVARWIVAGEMERHLARMRRVYEERRDVMCDELERARRLGTIAGFDVPDGGMAVWVDLGARSEPWSAAALRRGVLVPPHSMYSPERHDGTRVRIGFAAQSPAELRRGLRLFWECRPQPPC